MLCGMSGLAASASARDWAFDAAPLGEVVKAGASEFGQAVRVCKSADAPVTGRFKFDDAAGVAGALQAKGHPVRLVSTGFEVGCDQAAIEQGPDIQGSFASSPALPSAAPAAAPAAPVEPTVYRRVDVRFRDPNKIINAVSKLPGLSVLAFPDVPGPLLLAGPADMVGEARRFIAALDTCPVQVEIQALVVTQGSTVNRSRRFGVQLRSAGDVALGGFDPTAGSSLTIPGLRAYLDALRERGEVRANRSFIGDVILGEVVSLSDGSQVPIQASAIITDRETRNNVTYRDVGHNLSFGLLAVADGQAVVRVDHQISGLSGNSTLGPVFSNQSTGTVMRLPLGKWSMISLSGTDRAQRSRSRGIFSRSDAVLSDTGGSYLVFALASVPCIRPPAVEDVQASRRVDAGNEASAKPSRSRK